MFLAAGCLPFSALAQKEFVQRILLDKPMTAGPLKLFPLVEDPNSYYYLPNKVRLGTDENGRPRFSFIRYVENVRSGANEKEASIGNGGGYVHLMVGLSVSPEEIKAAEQELRNINPRGKIVGTVTYRGGTMALISKSVITNATGDGGQHRVLGVGPAPVIEGDQVAVSFLLDKTDATILHESLKSATPDVSFNLNMTLAGYQSPVEFKIEMEWDKIYQHDIFNAGLATPVLQAEIGIAAQQLKETGGIKITQIGEDPNMQRLQELLTNKLIDMCFVPFGREGSPNWTDLAQPLNGGKSYLDRATEQLNNERARQRTENQQIRQENRDERRYTDEENRRRREENDARAAANNNNGGSAGGSSAGGTSGGTTTGEATAAPIPAGPRPSRPVANGTTGPAPSERDAPVVFAQPVTAVQGQENSLQSVNAVVSYQRKSIRHTGKYTAEARTFFTTSLTEVFGGNIGKINCRDCIREVNTNDPLYHQRELVCFIDGEISQDFDKFINYVSVSMRKKHAGGEITTDELTVNRKNFGAEGNNFKLMYGWRAGDNDRRNWLNYEFKTVWNFFGGATVESDWSPTVNPIIPLKAPVKRRTVNIIADAEKARQNNIRSATVRVFYKIAGGEEQVKQTSLNIGRQMFNGIIDFILPKDQSEFEYEIEWIKGENESVKTGRLKTSLDDIYVDSPPAR